MVPKICGDLGPQRDLHRRQPLGSGSDTAELLPVGHEVTADGGGGPERRRERRIHYVNIILLRDAGRKPVRLTLGVRRLVALAGLTTTTLLLLAGGGGYLLGDAFGLRHSHAGERLLALEATLMGQRQAIAALQEESDRQLDAIALRLGELQARSARLEALGERLTQMGKLEDGEFTFGKPPALGGAVVTSEALPDQVDVLAELATLDDRLERQARELLLLESLIADRELDRSLLPAGRPVETGWLSSRYGRRVDPFSGKPDHHPGIDFSGRPGDPIIVVADGVVVRAARHPQYGLMVDVDHGNGYLTRYAHNRENLVVVGDRVRAGDVIAKMGSTGRATGTHVHFEVFLDGRRVDPMRVVSEIRG